MNLPFPVLGLELAWPLLIGLGFLSGFIGALFGVGGGIITTSFLNIVGAPMPVAVGTSSVVIAGSAAATTVRNRRLRNIEWTAGLWLAAFMLPAVELSALLLRHVQATNPAGLDPWLRGLFIVTVCWTTAVWWMKKDGVAGGGGLWGRVTLRPRVRVGDDRHLSVWVLAGSGAMAGVFAGLLGLGGGRIIMPVLLGVVGLEVKRAVGTSSLVILLSSVYASVTYGLKGLSDYGAVGLLLAGALAGSWIGNASMFGLPPRLLRHLYLALSVNSLLALGLKQAGAQQGSLAVLLTGSLLIALVALGRRFVRTA